MPSPLLASTTLGADGTTPAITTTGATLLVVAIANFGALASGITVTDSKGNIWHTITASPFATTSYSVTIFYSYNSGGGALVLGTGHTATISGGAFEGIVFAAFNGTLASGSTPLDQQNTNGATAATPYSSGSITPTQNGCLVLSTAGQNTTNGVQLTVNGNFTLGATFAKTASAAECGLAYYVQPTAGSVAATWTDLSGNCVGAAIASFLPPVAIVTSNPAALLMAM